MTDEERRAWAIEHRRRFSDLTRQQEELLRRARAEIALGAEMSTGKLAAYFAEAEIIQDERDGMVKELRKAVEGRVAA
jgi:hypothetical protein